MTPTETTHPRNPTAFFLLVFAYSWTLWLPSVLSGLGVITLPFDVETYTLIVVPIGAFAPLLAAITLMVRHEGWRGAGRLIRRGFDFHVKPLYIAIALLLPLAVTAFAHYLTNLTGIDMLPATFFPDDLPVPVIVAAVPYFFFILLLGGGQEEFGWRGYAQEPLQDRIGILPASLVIGVIWGVWHLPLWYMPGDAHNYYPFVAFLIYVVAVAVQYGWLHNASSKKLLVVWLMHAMSNTAAPLFPTFKFEPGLPQPGYWVFVGVNVVVSLVIALWLIPRLEHKHSPAE